MKKLLSIALALFISLSISAQIDRSKVPASGATPEIKLPEAEKWELKNGLKVIFVENHKLPTVTMSLRFDYLGIKEGEKAGMSSIFGSMMSAGTKNRTKEQIFEEVESLGARLSTSSNGIYVSTLKKNYKKVFEIFADVLLNPVFPEAEFDKEIKQTLTGLEAGEKDNNTIARRVRSAVLYGQDHPYGEVMTPETVKNVELEDVKNLYSTYFKPNIAYLVVTGDLSRKELKKLVKKYLNKWEEGTVPELVTTTPVNPDKPVISFVNSESATQSVIAVTNVVELKNSSPDYFAANAANSILGGSGSARLFMNLREDKGYTYGAYSSLGADRLVSNFYSGASVRNAVTDSALVQIFHELNKIRNEEVSDEELNRQKISLFGAFAKSLESPRTIANFYLNEEILGLQEGYYANYLKEVNKVDKEAVKKAADKYILPDNSNIVIVGKAVDVIPDLKKLGYKINYYDSYARPVEEPSLAQPVPAGVTVKSVIDDFNKKIGGEEKLRKIKSLKQEFTSQVGPYSIDGKISSMLPNKLSTSMEMQGTTIMENKFNGEKGYIVSQGRKMDYPEAQLNAAKNNRTIFPWLYFEDEGYKTTLESLEPVDDKMAYKMKVDNNGTVAYYYFDTESKLLIQSKQSQEVQGQKVESTTWYENYKDYDGILLPEVMKVKNGPQLIEMKFKSALFNKGVSAKDFN